MKRLALALLLALASGAVLRAEADVDSPANVTKAAYHSAMVHFGFSPETLKFEKKWLAPDLYARLLKKANQPVPKGDAPDIEGDVILDCQDPPTSFAIGEATIDGARAQVGVTLNWPGEVRHCVVLLKQIDGVWKTVDIDFAKDGRLTDLLK